MRKSSLINISILFVRPDRQIDKDKYILCYSNINLRQGKILLRLLSTSQGQHLHTHAVILTKQVIINEQVLVMLGHLALGMPTLSVGIIDVLYLHD